MNPQNDSSAQGMWAWWSDPPRSGLRLFIAPWQYRHLRAWAGVHIGAAIVLAGLGIVTLFAGGHDWATYGWTAVFLAAAVAAYSFAYWELAIARSQAARS